VDARGLAYTSTRFNALSNGEASAGLTFGRFMPAVLRNLLLCSLLFAAACSPFDKVMKSADVNYKLTKANEYYDKKQYQKASELYQSLLPVLRGTRNFEPLLFRYAYCYYNMKDYLMASFQFKNFADQFPTSRDAEEASYRHAESIFRMAPKASLEQTNTAKAMEALQSFINGHPGSKYIAEATTLIDEGRKKLEDKEAESAKLYFQLGQHKAASIAYAAVLREYPESPAADFYQYMVVRSLYNYAQRSIESRQPERYAAVVTAYRELAELYPTSPFVKEAEALQTAASSEIEKLKS